MTLFGWDLSHYDSPAGGAAVGEGFTFFTHKAGGDANDAEMASWWSAMKGYRGRALLGAYWVLYPGSATSRADAFLSRLDATCPGWRDGPFILQVDCEKWNGDSSTVPSKADIKTFCDRLVAKMPKLRPIVYAPQWVYGNTLTGLGYPLWASSYVNGAGTASGLYPGDDSSKWAAYSGQTPAVLQFTSSATIAGQTTCDANAYRGTLAELTNLVSPGWEVDMDLTSDNLADIAQAVASKLHLDLQTSTSGLAKDVVAVVKTIPAAPSAASVAAAVAALPPPEVPVSVDVDALVAALTPMIKDLVKDALREGTGTGA